MSAEELKPIQTTWKGWKFRSRTEARWAVFLDRLGVEFRYEEEGFDLEGTWYLPDFWIAQSQCFVEIKSDYYERPGEKQKKLAQRADVIMLCGRPWPEEYMVWVSIRGDMIPFPTASFAACNDCHACRLLVSTIDGLKQLKILRNFTEGQCSPSCVVWWHLSHRDDSSCFYFKAFKAARSARFEHGESPA